ncbi:MAG: M36 family metallopeptidase [Verrucomicrobiales bacterium]|nr:M36 family metallopeptidase [Verrucomicrobiales bacterium]
MRPYRYTTDLGVNPQTYGNIQSGLSVPHGIGSVWCTTIWEVYWKLVGAHGFDADLYNGTGGNNIALDLIIEGMKLQPANPTYLDARDAIILADQAIYGGANNEIIWQAFAKRGMGFSALDGGSASSLSVTEAFDLHDESLSITDVSVLEGDSGTIQATFTVSLCEASADEVRVNWTTENGSAAAPDDFNTASGQLVFPIGTLSRTVSIAVKGDNTPEADEDFSVQLFNPTGASILKGTGVGTIENDDFIVPVITSNLSVLAIDGFPFQYQIEADNTARSYAISSAPAGMIVDSITGVVSWTPSSEGSYSFHITATNPAGSDTETVQVEVLENSLQTALDIGEITIFSSLTPWSLQTEVTHDGTDAAQSGPVTHNEASTMQMEIQGPETIFFWWKVSSEENYDYLRFSVEGEVIDEIHGEVDWRQVRYDLPEDKSYTVRWDYDKDGSVDIGTDAGWVDKLVLLTFDPRPFITSPITGVGVKGQEFSYQIETSKPATSFSSTALPQGLSLNTSTGLISGTPVSGGNTPVSVTVSNAAGETTETLNILILELVTLPFSENFESGQIESYWAVTGTNTYRTEVSQAQFPRGDWHLLMDSSQDQSYSRNELTFYSDIRGLHDVELKFWARDYNDEEHGPPASPFMDGADFDGVAISPDRVHWYEVQPLRSQINGTYSEYTIDINAAMTARGLDYGEFFGIRFNHFDNYELSTDGFAFDDISLTGSAASVSAPTLSSASDWGVSNSDGITGDTTPTFSGTGTAGTEVTLRSDIQGIVKKGNVNGSGNWTITTNTLSAGTHLITASVHGGVESAPVSVKIESSIPGVMVTKAAGQADPASSGPVVFDIVFSEDVIGFTSSDLDVTGSIAGNVSLTGGPANYQATIALTGSEGAISLTIPSGAAEDYAGNQSLSSNSPDNYVEIDAHPGSSGSPTQFPLSGGTGMQSAWLESTDTDTFTFTLSGPRMARIHTTGQVNTRGELRDANGDLLNDPNSDDNAGGGSNFDIRETLRAGTYTVVVTANNDQGSYDLHVEAVDIPMIQPDMQISGSGDDIYDTLTGQSSSLSSRRGAPVSAVSTVENDGEITDTFTLSAARGNSTFKVNYISRDEGNITAAVVAGTHRIEDMDPNDDPYSITTSVRPAKNKIRKKLPKKRQRGGNKFKYKVRSYTTILRVVSDVSETQADRGSIKVKTTK